jgi:hypothetical protein
MQTAPNAMNLSIRTTAVKSSFAPNVCRESESRVIPDTRCWKIRLSISLRQDAVCFDRGQTRCLGVATSKALPGAAIDRD